MRTLRALLWLSALTASFLVHDAAYAASQLFILEEGAEPRAVAPPADLEVTAMQRLGEATILAGVDQPSGAVSLVMVGPGKSMAELPQPATSAHPQRPLALVDGEALVGAAWLAGDGTRLTVEAAVWQGAGWSNTNVVSAAGPGSQLALRGALADDGRAVLVWSRFDGEDDEIMWSRLESSGWSTPRRVGADDAVPDITPALGLIDGRLVLAWSEWDGDAYRLRLARLEGDDWVAIGELPEKGAFAPQFEADGVLSYRDGAGQRWVAREPDAAGVSKQATTFAPAAAPTPVRPQLLVGDGRSYWIHDGVVAPATWEH